MLSGIIEFVRILKSEGITSPVERVVLGTGLGDRIKHIDIIKLSDYTFFPISPTASMEFHSGKLAYSCVNEEK